MARKKYQNKTVHFIITFLLMATGIYYFGLNYVPQKLYETQKMKPNQVIRIETSQRSSTASAKEDIATMVRTVFEMAGASVSHGDGYPGWKPNPHSEILEIATESYKRLFGVEAKVKAIHAGLECGLFLDKYPHLDMISFGPTLQGVHSPDERMLIPTVQKFWDHLVDILKHIPAKQ